MTTITGLTAARMLAIEAASVVDGTVQVDNLILTTHGGTIIDAGNVRGPKGDMAYGPNYFINGSLSINQRNFSSVTTDNSYCFDRWALRKFGNTTSVTPVNSYSGFPQKFRKVLRLASSLSGASNAGHYTAISQKIEGVKYLAGETVTVSFWAAASTGTPSVAISCVQNFGTGGSSSVRQNLGKVQINSTPLRYSITATIPSITGKTIGSVNDDYLEILFYTDAGSNFNSETLNLGMQFATIDFVGFQIEEGSSVTRFETLLYSEELRKCQRYYYKSDLFGSSINFNAAASLAYSSQLYPHPVPLYRVGSPISSFTDAVYSSAENLSWGAISLSAGRIILRSTQTNTNCNVIFASGNYVGVDAEL